jgi:hypothetical protein
MMSSNSLRAGGQAGAVVRESERDGLGKCEEGEVA